MNKEKMNLTAVAIAVLFLMNGLSFAEPESKGSVSPPDRGYTYNLKELIEKAKENIKKVDKELAQKAVEDRNMQKEAKAQEYFEKGNILYEQGKLQEAKQEWQKALEITKSPELEEYIKISEKKSRDRDLARQKEEKERQARIKEAERRAKQQAEEARLEKERKQKEEQKQLEKKKESKKEEQEPAQNFNQK